MNLEELKLSKAPLPSLEVLGVTQYGNSWTIESSQPLCGCGRLLGVLEYDIALVRANNPNEPSDKIYRIVADSENLQICCRNNFLNRSSHTVNTLDIGVFFDERNNVSIDALEPILGGNLGFTTDLILPKFSDDAEVDN